MQNMVGDNVPSDAKIAKLLTDLAAILGQLEAFCVTLDADDREGTAKPPHGGPTMTAKIDDLAGRHGIVVKNVPRDGMMNDLRLSAVMQRFAPLMTRGKQLVTDTQLQANSEYWTAALAYYGALGQAAEHDPALAAELKPIQDEMRALRRRKAPKEPAPEK